MNSKQKAGSSFKRCNLEDPSKSRRPAVFSHESAGGQNKFQKRVQLSTGKSSLNRNQGEQRASNLQLKLPDCKEMLEQLRCSQTALQSQVQTSKRMTTINEAGRDEWGSVESCSKVGLEFVKLDEEARAREQVREVGEKVRECEEKERALQSEIGKLREQADKMKRKKSLQSSQKDQGKKVEQIKKSIQALEKEKEGLCSEKSQLLEKQDFLQKQLDSFLQKHQELEKDERLKEMEQLIKEMARKLEEKDKVLVETQKQQLEQTQCLKELQQTVKILQTKKILVAGGQQQTQQEETFSPKGKKVDRYKGPAVFDRKYKKKMINSGSQVFGQTDCNPQSLLQKNFPLGQLHPHKQSMKEVPVLTEDSLTKLPPDQRKRLDKRTNNSTANLFYKCKPGLPLQILSGEEEAKAPDQFQGSLKHQAPKSKVKGSFQDSTKVAVQQVNAACPTKKGKAKDSPEKEEVDEGVQSEKKSVVPIKQISNLMSGIHVAKVTITKPSGSNYNSFSKTNMSFETSLKPPQAQKENRPVKKESIKLSNFTSQTKPDPKMTTCSVQLKVDSDSQSNCMDKSLKEEGLEESMNEQLQNTPPRIKEKISSLASKNKFCNEDKHKALDAKIKSIDQSDAVLQDRKSQLRQERKDNFLRKSFELMSTLRHSVDQAQQLKPIKRTAGMRSLERTGGVLSTKNAQSMQFTSFQQQHIGVCKSPEVALEEGYATGEVGHCKTLDLRQGANKLQARRERKITDLKEARIRNRSSQSNHRIINLEHNHEDTMVFGSKVNNQTLQYQNNFSLAELNKTKSGIFSSQDLEQKMQELDSLMQCAPSANRPGKSCSQLSQQIQDQLMVKCIKQRPIGVKKGSVEAATERVQSIVGGLVQQKYKENGGIRGQKSEKDLTQESDTKILITSGHDVSKRHPKVDRPRSITIEQSYSTANNLGSILMNDRPNNNGQNINLSASTTNIPKWTQLAQIIKQNISPNSAQNQIDMQNERKETQQESEMQMQSINNQHKQYMVKYNKIDLSQVSPQNQFKPSFLAATQQQRKDTEQSKGNSSRGRSESSYIPLLNSRQQLQIRTPRGHNPTQLGLQSPACQVMNNKLVPEQSQAMIDQQLSVPCSVANKNQPSFGLNWQTLGTKRAQLKNELSASADFSQGMTSGLQCLDINSIPEHYSLEPTQSKP